MPTSIVEKPLTTSADGVRRIAEAAERTGRQVTVTFNYRYSPRNTALKQIIASGQIGDVTSVHFEWLLDTAHGADYFRRWHRNKENSGGLLVHKSSHHFDLVNWWLDDVPARVFASGGLRFYGAEAAARRGLGPRPERGTTDSGLRDAFCLDLRHEPQYKALYLDQEHHDGYRRDQDVFDSGITIEDNMSLVVDYASGASMSYSLNAHAPWEGYTVACQRHQGPRRAQVVERGSVTTDADGRVIIDPSARPDLVADDKERPSANGWSCSATSRRPARYRSRGARAATAVATRSCCATCSPESARIPWATRRPGATVCGPWSWASPPTAPWRPVRRCVSMSWNWVRRPRC